MPNNRQPDFIVIDDDPVNNKICERCIKIRFPGANIRTFLDPIDGIAHLKEVYSSPEANNAILFLDINMPNLSGWDVLEKIAELPGDTKAHFKTFILSSSVADEDKQKAYNNPLVAGFVEKPITLHLRTLFPG
jgi:CheY-like chemotaxis protein